jgi:hypothetical protein
MFELIDRVRYPDESSVGINDKDLYCDVEEGLKLMIAHSDGQAKIDAQETLEELEKRWSEKQEAISELQHRWKERQSALRAISI